MAETGCGRDARAPRRSLPLEGSRAARRRLMRWGGGRRAVRLLRAAMPRPNARGGMGCSAVAACLVSVDTGQIGQEGPLCVFLSLVAAEQECGVGAPEAEGIWKAHTPAAVCAPGWVIVQVAIRVGVLVVDGRRNDLMVKGQDRNRPLQASAAPAGGRSWIWWNSPAYGRRAGRRRVDGHGLQPVIDGRGGAVSVDVVDLLRPNTSVIHRVGHDLEGPFTVSRGLGDVKGIPRHAVPHNFGVDGGAAPLGPLHLLQHQDSEPSPITKPSRSRSKGRQAFSGSSFRVDRARMEANPPTLMGVMAASDPPQSMASASPRAMIRNESPMAWDPEEQAVQVAVLGPLAPNRMESCPAARLIMEEGMKKGEIRLGPPSQELGVFPLDGGKTSDPRSDVYPESGRQLRCYLQSGRTPWQNRRRRHGVLDEGIHFLHVFFGNPVQRIESLDLPLPS